MSELMQCGQWQRTGLVAHRGWNPAAWRVQLGEGTDGDLWEVTDLLLERVPGKEG